MNDKEKEAYLNKLSILRRGYSGIFRNTRNNGETWEYYAVKYDGSPIPIDPGKYFLMKGRYAKEQKSHDPTTKNYGGIYGYFLTF